MHNRLKPLVALPFIICLVLLIANDFYFKATFHNLLTGKLSDFCGLFIFPIFWSALFPKHKLWVFILSAVLFIYWKSEYASPIIEFFGSYVFSLQRTIDYTDLLALPVLGLAWLSLKNKQLTTNLNPFLLRLATYFIAVATFFSFCATSKAQYVQSFDQPQYLLFKSAVLPDSNSYDDGFEFFKFDSLLVVKVTQMYTSDEAVKDDDYNKNQVIKNLDEDVISMVQGEIRLVPAKKITSLTVKTPFGDDYVRFNGSRLDGRFIRKKSEKTIIEGFYKMGIEDSVWTVKDTSNNHITKITFVKGERTMVQQYDADKLISSNSVNTRADTRRNKQIQIGLLAVLMIVALVLLGKNYFQKSRDTMQMETAWKWLAAFVLPFCVWVFQFGITQLLGDYKADLFSIIATIIIIYLATCPLFFIIIFWIKLSRKIDMLWYSLFFALAYSIWVEYSILGAL